MTILFGRDRPNNNECFTESPIFLSDIFLYQANPVRHYLCITFKTVEPRHDKTNRMSVRPANTQISLGIRPVWSESSMSAWRKLRSLATHWAQSEDSDQTGRMPWLIWVFAGRTQTIFGGGILFSRCLSVHPSVRPSFRPCVLPPVTFWFFFNILKRQWWKFIKFGRHIDIDEMYVYNRN